MFIFNQQITQSYHWEMWSAIISLLTLMPNDCILDATSLPILPSPTIPRTLPYSSAPMNCKTKTTLEWPHLGNLQLHRFKCHVWLAMADWTMEPSMQQWFLCVPTANSMQTNQSGRPPFCDPSCLVSSTLQLEAHFWNQNGRRKAILHFFYTI